MSEAIITAVVILFMLFALVAMVLFLKAIHESEEHTSIKYVRIRLASGEQVEGWVRRFYQRNDSYRIYWHASDGSTRLPERRVARVEEGEWVSIEEDQTTDLPPEGYDIPPKP